MTQRVCTAALNYAAEIIAAAIGVEEVSREPIGPDQGEEETLSETKLIAALSEGTSQEGEYLMGSATPHEFEHGAAFQLLAVEGAETERRARCETAIMRAADAIAADPTLGGLVDYAELTEPTLDNAPRYTAIAAQLTLTYSAPTALG